jgi:alcohol dehydrogenase class IV
MVSSFSLLRIPRIIFGAGKLSLLPGLINSYGKTALILTGKESFQRSKPAGILFNVLTRQGIACHKESIFHEPSPADVDNLVKEYAGAGIQLVIAIGGGSVMDAGKAVSAMLPLQESVMNYLEGLGNTSHPGVKIPFIAVPTTAGTGSETTSNAVLSETGIHGFKRSLRHENFIPDIALIDPGLTVTCSPDQTAFSGMDAFTQLLESYLSARSNDFTDALALEGIMHIKRMLKNAVTDGEDIESRSGISYAAMLSGITLANAGLGLVHGFASSLGGLKKIPHGIICGALMGIVNRNNIEKLLKANSPATALIKYIRLGKILSEEDGRSDVDYAFYVANYIETLTDELKIPRLNTYQLTPEEIERIARSTDHKNNPVTFSKDELAEMIYKRI